MRSSKLAFDHDYMTYAQFNMEPDDLRLFNLLTNDYEFRCEHYVVAYNFLRMLDKLDMCEHSGMLDDCFWPYSWIIFFSCKPNDALRMKHVAKHLPYSKNANIRIYEYDEDIGENIEI